MPTPPPPELAQTPDFEQPGDQSELSTIEIPAINPFLWAERHIKHAYNMRRGRRSESDTEEDYEIDLIVPSPPTAIHTAKELKTYNPAVYSTSDAEDARTIAANLYSRYHYIHDDAMERFVIPAEVDKQSAKGQRLMKSILDRTDQYQSAIMRFYKAGVDRAVEEMGGIEIWERATRRERLLTFAKFFDQHPLDVATAALGPVAYAVPLQTIFSDSTALHQKWQQFHRTIFLLACEDTFELRVATSSPQSKACYWRWKALAESDFVKRLDLGDGSEVPVHWATSVLHRRQAPRVALGTGPTDSDMEGI